MVFTYYSRSRLAGMRPPDLPAITTVTFDLWQTLLVDNRELGLIRSNARLEGVHRILSNNGEHFEPEHISDAYWECFRQCAAIREELRDVSFPEQIDIFIESISPGLCNRLNPSALSNITRVYADSFLDYPPPAHSDALEVLKSVQSMGMRMGMISNTGMTPGSTFRTYLANTGMLDYFETLTFSDEVKMAKPSTEIFRLTLREMNVTPEQTIHVGDSVRNDVAGAKLSGLKTVWITGFSEREDPTDPTTEPDETVGGLAEVVPAIRRLSGTG